MSDAELARNYILDRLSDDDREACERRFLFEPEFEMVALEQERILLDDYVNARLSAEDSETVLQRVAQEPGHLYRLRFAEGLRRAAADAARPSEQEASFFQRLRSSLAEHRVGWAGGLAGAAAAVAAIVVVAIAMQHRGQQVPAAQTAAAPALAGPALASTAPSPSVAAPGPRASGATAQRRSAANAGAATSMATFVLLANQQRGDGEAQTVTLKPAVATLRLQLTTEEGLDPGRYSAVVSDARGAKIFTASHQPTRTEAGRRYIDLRMPAALLAVGGYTINLTEDSAAASGASLLYQFSFLPSRPARDAQQ